MPTIHDDIESWLAASVHDQLSVDERAALQKHLATCEACRALHVEEIAMNKMLNSTFGELKPDLAFEQRVLSGFRKKVPQRAGLMSIFAELLRFRATRIAGAAVILIGLTLSGVWLTTPHFLGNEELAVQAVSSEHSLAALREELGFAEFKTSPEGRRILQRPPQSFSAPNLAADNAKAAGKPQSVPADSVVRQMQNPAAPPASAETSGSGVALGGGALDSSRRGKFTIAGVGNAVAGLAAPPEEANSAPESDSLRVLQKRNSSEEEPNTAAPADNRKLVRNAEVELEVLSFNDAVEKITTLATEGRGYVATSSSEKQANGKLRGQVVVKILPETLDAFLLKLRGLGELKNQTLGTEDVTKQYFDTDSRLKNARVMETRLIDILKTKSSKVADLLEVEKELGRVRQQIEEMQGALKYMDAQVQFATVTITLAEKDMNLPAAFLLKRRARLALFSTDVEKTFAEVKGLIDGAKAQLSSSSLDRDSAGEATARLVVLIVPEEADGLIGRIKGMGRVQNYNEQTDRIAQGGGSGMAENAKVERDKVELSLTISRNEQEPALQTTSLRILTSEVTEKVARLKENAAKAGAEIRSSSFNRNPDGQEFANIMLRVPMKNYPALLSSFDQLGKVKDVSVQRDDRRGTINEETAPADISIQVHSQPNIVSDETGLFATIRHTLGQGALALMWSLRMIGVAIAFLAPWAIAFVIVGWIMKRIARARAARKAAKNGD